MKMNRVTCFILVAVLVLGCFILNADITTVKASSEIIIASSDDFIYNNTGSAIFISEYIGTDAKIIIPETIEGLPVTEFSSHVFSENEKIEYIQFPSGTSNIDPNMFYLCSSLTEIVVPESNPYYTTEKGVVYNKDKTTLISYPCGKSGHFIVPNTVISIGKAAFSSCYNLTAVRMNNNVLNISDQAFLDCWNMESIKLSDNLETLGFRALAFCSSLTEIHLPASLKNIGNQAVIGGIDSDSNWYYSFTDGIYYVPNTPSEKFIKSLHVPKKYTIAEPKRITDAESNISILDPNNILPSNVEFSVTPISEDEFSSLIPIRYESAYAYKLELKVNGKTFTPKKDIVIEFGNKVNGTISSATKAYELKDGALFELFRQPYAPFVGTQTNKLGTYVVVTNSDFSLPGDIDGDGVVSTYDTIFALCLASDLVPIYDLTDQQFTAANVDSSDAVITTKDALKILRYAAGIEK